MNSDDEKRLAEIRAKTALSCEWETWSRNDVDWLLAKVAELEQAWKVAEELAETRLADVTSLESRAEKAEAALAEESAKRKTVVQFSDEHMQALREARDRQKERAEAAEAALVEERAKRETELTGLIERHNASHERLRRRAEAAEARVRELEARIAGLEK